jgi:GNAT superfamily N-acetyltransferase
VAELADLLRTVADGSSPAADQELTVLCPPDDRSVGILAFSGHHVVCVDLPDGWVRSWLPSGDLSAPLAPPFVTVLAAATGRAPGNLDTVLVARATGRSRGMDLTELTEADLVVPGRPRIERALAHRVDVRAWTCPGGLLVLGRGVAGRWEVAVEVDETVRGFGLGRALFASALGLLPAGEWVWAQVAPGNAASARAALAAGFRPVGAELLLEPDPIRPVNAGEPFTWFLRDQDDGYWVEPERDSQRDIEPEPNSAPESVITDSQPNETDE